MNLIELQHSLRQLRLGGIAAVLETRLHQAQAEPMAPIDLISCLISDELTRRSDRLLERRRKQAGFRDPNRTLDNFDFAFNPKINRSLVFDLATGAFIGRREDALFLGPGGDFHIPTVPATISHYRDPKPTRHGSRPSGAHRNAKKARPPEQRACRNRLRQCINYVFWVGSLWPVLR